MFEYKTVMIHNDTSPYLTDADDPDLGQPGPEWRLVTIYRQRIDSDYGTYWGAAYAVWEREF